jgi:hypothetical protein
MEILNPIALILLALATYRISRLLIADVIFDNLRNKIWEKFQPNNTKIGYLFTCYWCMSIWVASLITICYTIVPVATTIACIPFALSAVAGLIANRMEH